MPKHLETTATHTGARLPHTHTLAPNALPPAPPSLTTSSAGRADLLVPRYAVAPNMSLRLQFLNLPQVSSRTLRSGGVYLSGILYSCAFYIMLDSALWSAHRNPSDVHIGFSDWLPLLLSSLGMAIINLVEKSRLNGGATFGNEYGPSNETWQAKAVLFMGFAFLSGGVAGSIVILVLRYIVHHHWWPVLSMGVENVVSAFCVMGSCLTLWVAQNLEDDYSYSLQL